MSLNLIMNWTKLYTEGNVNEKNELLSVVDSLFPVSSHYQNTKENHSFWASLFESEVVFYGGSFYPWHNGHQACLNKLPENKLCLILPDRNPQKDLMVKTPFDYFNDLTEKIELNSNRLICPSFILSPHKNPTINWIRKIKIHFPNSQLSLLMGFDALRSILSWIEADELIKQLKTIYVLSRLEEESEASEIKSRLLELYPHLLIQYLGHHEFENLSSTDLRK